MFTERSLVLLLASACAELALAAPSAREAPCTSVSRVAVANRGSGSVSVIDVATKKVAFNVTLPPKAEPMYINVVGGDMWVGDRGNDAIHVYSLPDYTLKRTIKTGAGVFHSQTTQTNSGKNNKRTTHVYVNNDIDKTTTVISALTYRVLAQIKTPEDLAAAGGKPHDVTSDGKSVWVTYLGFEDKSGYVVGFSARTYAELCRAKVGGDPHVAQRPKTELYVASQDAGKTTVLNKKTLAVEQSEDVPASHGAWVSTAGTFYNTNIGGGGANALWTFNFAGRGANSLNLASPPTATTVPTPHNVATDVDETHLFVTHSGPTSTSVSVFPLVDGVPVAGEGAVVLSTGLNPFGLWPYKETNCEE